MVAKKVKASQPSGAILTEAQDSSETERSFSLAEPRPAKVIEIGGQNKVRSLRFLADGKYIVGGGNGTVLCWEFKNGEEMPMPVDAGGAVSNIAVLQDGKWILTSSTAGKMMVWNAETHEKVVELDGRARVTDISPDATRIVAGLDDLTISVWSLLTGQRLLGPLEHYPCLGDIKFSPDGCLLAATAWL